MSALFAVYRTEHVVQRIGACQRCAGHRDGLVGADVLVREGAGATGEAHTVAGDCTR
jgi:hypothetical protein